jgi:hypothetical protein
VAMIVLAARSTCSWERLRNPSCCRFCRWGSHSPSAPRSLILACGRADAGCLNICGAHSARHLDRRALGARGDRGQVSSSSGYHVSGARGCAGAHAHGARKFLRVAAPFLVSALIAAVPCVAGHRFILARPRVSWSLGWCSYWCMPVSSGGGRPVMHL